MSVYGSLAELLDAGVDAVTITTPPHTRHDLVMEAITAGVHVVADKPFTPMRRLRVNSPRPPRGPALS